MEMRQHGETDAPPRRTVKSLFTLDRRSSDEGASLWAFLRRSVSRRKAVTVIGTVMGVAGATAWKTLHAADAPTGHDVREYSAIDSTLTALGGRSVSNEQRISVLEQWRGTSEKENDSLRFELRQTNQYLCIISRKIDPTVAGPDCYSGGRRR